MAWCVDTLKIIGEGRVEKSTLCNFEFFLGYLEDFLVIDERFEIEIKIIIFPQSLFEETFFGTENPLHTMHFIKYREGKEDWIKQKDIQLIAEEYKKRTGKQLSVTEIFRC
ncbi:hypothetical protein [Priestia koreensis]|uniref:hypothetical protein n=1 Tax=Priestia koreensis TaxID=284581 RepID=UPI001F58D5B0|nr:hypothetical protein [Priestia koreensis]UNL85728.1 hypothetical protein IE339_04230 [Priestia koreensis]